MNFVVGTAAELIKIYPLIQMALEREYAVRVIPTGQSRENFLMQYRDFGLDEGLLAPMLASQGDLEHAGSALRWFMRVLLTPKKAFRSRLLSRSDKQFVLVHGDTLSTLVGAWLGYRCGLRVVHVEAGLRAPSLFNPFPEEITRRLVSRFARWHMVPDLTAQKNLERAKVRGTIVCTQGNTLMDAVRLSAGLSSAEQVQAPPRDRFVLVNIHRFENLNSAERWSVIVDTVCRAAEKHAVIFVMHPQTRHKLQSDPAAKQKFDEHKIEIRERMPFTQFIGLLKQAEYLISDGGSNQEECSYLGKPCLLLRMATERQEGLDTCCLLTRFEKPLIERFLADPGAYRSAPLIDSESPSTRILATLIGGPQRS